MVWIYDEARGNKRSKSENVMKMNFKRKRGKGKPKKR